MKLNKSIALIGLIAGLLSPSSLAAQEVINFNSLNTSIKMQPEVSKNEMSMISNQKEKEKYKLNA